MKLVRIDFTDLDWPGDCGDNVAQLLLEEAVRGCCSLPVLTDEDEQIVDAVYDAHDNHPEQGSELDDVPHENRNPVQCINYGQEFSGHRYRNNVAVS